MPPKKKKHKKRAYKKSRYYRRRQQITERLLIGCGAVLILLLLIILVRGCSARKNGAIKTNASAKSQDETSATGGAHLCSIQYYLRFWPSSCRTSLAVSALRIMRYCLRKITP